MLFMQGTWKDELGREWQVSRSDVKFESATSSLEIDGGAVLLTAGETARKVASCVKYEDGSRCVRWDDGGEWRLVRDLWDLEEQHHQDEAAQQWRLEGTNHLIEEIRDLRAMLIAKDTLLWMQGKWEDARGSFWHVHGQAATCDDARRDLWVTKSGEVCLTLEGATRRVKHCAGNALTWDDGGKLEIWTFLRTPWDLHAESQTEVAEEVSRTSSCAIRYLSAFSLSTACTSHVLAVSDPCYRFLSEALLSSVRGHRLDLHSAEWCEPAELEIQSIQILHNDYLTQMYASELGRLPECPPTSVAIGAWPCYTSSENKNQHFLFHGASASTLRMIRDNGFDPRRAGESAGGLFGLGAYFAENASKADLYSKPDSTGQRSQLLVRVALGNAYAAKTKMPTAAHAPYTDHSKTQMYDSVLALTRDEGGCVDFREYVVYKAAQALPVAQLWYRHLPHCKCNLCRRSGSG